MKNNKRDSNLYNFSKSFDDLESLYLTLSTLPSVSLVTIFTCTRVRAVSVGAISKGVTFILPQAPPLRLKIKQQTITRLSVWLIFYTVMHVDVFMDIEVSSIRRLLSSVRWIK